MVPPSIDVAFSATHTAQSASEPKSTKHVTNLGHGKEGSLSPEDLEAIMRWNRYPPKSIQDTLTGLFENQVRLRPSAPAICSWDLNYTYAELDDISYRLAGELVRQGVVLEETVALCFDKSAMAIVSMLAVLRAGGAFVHLGVSNPAKRMGSIFMSSKAKRVLCDTQNKEKAEALGKHPLVIDENFLAGLADFNTPFPVLNAGHAASIIFTSGSTGSPKGIVVEHGSLATSCVAMGTRLNIGPQTRILQFAAYTFDVSVADIFYSLSRGACICSLSEQERLNDLSQAARRMRVNWAFLTPSVASLISPHDIPSLKTLLLGGEAPTRKNIAMWAQSVSLHLVTGPAECAVYCAASEAISIDQDPSTVGRAAGCRMWVVDPEDHTKLAPIGQAGELVIEGRIVARGYINDAERTQQVFFEQASWLPELPTGRQHRLYRTGDLVRFNPNDGTFSFVARKDNQVKLHGQRVELGEIEHHIKTVLPEIDSAIALLNNVEARSGRHVLVAFLVCSPGSSMVQSTERSTLPLTNLGREMVCRMQMSLTKLMPTYMIPTLFIPILEVPLTANGKRDTARLHRILGGLSSDDLVSFSLSGDAVIGPSDPLEKKLRTIWAQVLGIDELHIGPNSDFIRLGGDSFAAMRLVADAASSGLRLTVRKVLENSRLSQIASSTIDSSSELQVLSPRPFSLLRTPHGINALRAQCASLCKVELDKVEDIYPSTPLQELLFTSSLKSPGTYITRLSYRLPSNILLYDFLAAWEQVYQSVDILRTRLVSDKEMGLIQTVVRDSINWVFHEDTDQNLKRDNPLSIGNGTRLLEFSIIRRDPLDAPIFAFICHHALYDALTFSMLFEKVASICMETSYPTLVPFKNYVAYIQCIPYRPSVEFWKEKLEGSPAPTWPPDSPQATGAPSAVQNFVPIQALSLEFTVATFAHAAYALLFAAYAGLDDVVYGMAGSGRDAPLQSVSTIAGPTIYTIPFRCKVNSQEPIRGFMERLRTETHEIAEHGHITLQHIRRASPDAAQACDFRSLLVLQPQIEPTASLKEVFGVPLSSTEILATFGLIFECTMVDGGVKIVAEYNGDGLDKPQVERFVRQFASLLIRLTKTSLDTLIDDVDLMSDEDSAQIQKWNSRKNFTSQQSIHDVIGARMLEFADKEAICGWDGSLTYRELDLLSARVAVQLQALGVNAETIVPICTSKSVWVPVAVVGVLRAGGAFLLIGPENPLERQKEIVGQVKAKLMIVSPELIGTWNSIVPNILELSASIRDWELPKGATSWHISQPHDLAYVVFTSGSTGRPKGVLIEHGAILTSALSRAAGIYRTSRSRVYQFSSYSFDTSVEDTITTLITGGTICIPSEDERKSDIVGSMKRYRVNNADLTPSVANILSPALLPDLEVLILAGEAMTESHVEKWAPYVKLINTYGPAETSIVATVAKPAEIGSTGDDIGKAPCGHTWVVDPRNHRKLAPVGAIGILLVDGPLLSRGYLDNPHKTDEVFVSNMPWAHPETRFYQTGDLVKYQENGNLTFIGRRDTQVKIYGQRVELGEIERRLLMADQISGAAVEFFKLSNNRQQLIAFFSFHPREGSGFRALEMSDKLRKILATFEEGLIQVLPRFMVPSILIPMTAMPLSATGKMDRKFLRRLVEDMPENELLSYSLVGDQGSEELLETDSQLRLRELWSQLLGVAESRIGRNSDFFRVGGDSITAMKLSMATLATFGCNMSVADIFRNPTLAGMAKIFDGAYSGSLVQMPTDPLPFSLLPDSSSVRDILERSSVTLLEAEIEDIYPCTPLQEGFLALGAGQKDAYIAHLVYEIPDQTNIDRLQEAWHRIIESNPILRTRIVYAQDYGSLQLVMKKAHDWTKATSLEQHLTSGDTKNMTYGTSLSRFCLVHESGSSRKFLIHTAHHAIFDGFSLDLLLAQVSRVYENIGEDVPLVPFTRFISYLEDIDSAEQDEFWRAQLEGQPSIAFMASKAAHETRREEGIMYASIPFIRNASGVPATYTSANVIRAAWAMLVSIYSDSNDILFGSTVSGRNTAVEGIFAMAAPTITTVPVRVIVNQEHSILDFIKQIQQQAVDMMPFEHYGLQNIHRVCPHATTFNNILVVQTEDNEQRWNHILRPVDLREMGLPMAAKQGVGGYHVHALVVDCTLDVDNIRLNINYDQTLVCEEQLQHVVSTFKHILHQMVTVEPNIPLSELVICSPQDRQQISVWNQTVPRKVERLMHELVQEQSVIHCGASAIEAWDGSLTYGELDLIASRLALFLSRKLDSLENIRIPLCFEKSMYTVVSMLAVWKLGAAYVPLESSYPSSRLHSIIKQVQATVVLASVSQAARFQNTVDVVIVDKHLLDRLSQSEEALYQPLPPITPESPAMIIFTSGSTGQPKGVVISHSGFSTLALGLSPELNLGPDTRALQFAAYAFDVSNAEIFLTLTHGGCVCIPTDHDRMNNLAQVINQMRVNWMYLTPTATSLIRGPEEVPGVKTLLLGGEAARKDIIDTWAQRVDLINTYGPAEGTIWPSITRFTAQSSPMEIGRGNDCQMWLVDQNNHHRLMPIGAMGEILLEGPLLAHGYFQDPDMTAKSFVQNLQWAAPSGSTRQFYRTGDLAIYNLDGSMSFSGRAGTMVKLRGQRLELGEVEAHMKRSLTNDTRVCVEVMSRADTSDKLVAFVAMPEGMDSTDDALVMRSNADSIARLSQLNMSLKSSLPSYMVPSLYVQLRQMPTTASGKTDRKPLRAWYQAATASELDSLHLASSEKQAPRTQNESRIQGLWSEVLGKSSTLIGVEDNFFQVGGDSLSAIRLAAMARNIGISLNAADIFLHPVLQDQATHCSDAAHISAPQELGPFRLLRFGENAEQVLLKCASQWGLSGVEDAYPCTPLQAGLIALSEQQQGAYIAYHTFRLPSNVDVNRLQIAWQSAIATFDILRTRIVPDPTHGLLQIVLKDDVANWQICHDISDAVTDTQLTAPYYGRPLTRYYLVQRDLSSDDFSFVLRIHHAIFDAYTLRMIINHVESCYHGEPIPTVIPYSHFVSYTEQCRTSQSREYWTTSLRGFEGAFYPPAPQKPQTSRKTGSVSVISTLNWSKDAGCTLATALAGAWAILQTSYTHSEDVVFGLTLSGRDIPIQGAVSVGGPTITTVPRRVRVNSSSSVGDFLNRLQEESGRLIEHQHYGLQNIAAIPEARDATKFRNLLVIDFAESSRNENLMRPESLSDIDDYHTYPLVIQCAIHASTGSDVTIKTTAIFDQNVMSDREVEDLLSQLTDIFPQLSNAAQTVDSIIVCSPAHVQQIAEWNSISLALPCLPHYAIHERILARAISSPDAHAVHSWDHQLTYKQLDNYSSVLSNHIEHQANLDSKEVVSICFEKSAWMIVSILAVLRCGRTYLLLDPSLPLQRRQTMMHQASSKIVLADPQNAGSLKVNANVIKVDDTLFEGFDVHQRNVAVREVQASPQEASAAIIFTSGTSGTPKGAVLTHRSICTWLDNFGEKLGFCAATRTLQFTSVAFDACSMEILATLMVGGCLCVPSEHDRLNRLTAVIREMNANWAFFTPTGLGLLNPDEVPSLKTVVLGGEPVKHDNIARWSNKVNLWSIYGPTECTVSVCAVHLVENSVPSNLGHIYGTSAWVVDATNPTRLAPLGAIGELYIEGPLVGGGYINDATRTSLSFTESLPWLPTEKGRAHWAYRTGDLVRYNDDGTLTYIGRQDAQVKLKGQRLELEEIEQHVRQVLGTDVLLAAEIISFANSTTPVVAVFFDAGPQAAKIKANKEFIQARFRDLILLARQTLRDTLPSYMLPSTYIPLPEIPMTTTGKIDRKTLRGIGSTMDSVQANALVIGDEEKRTPSSEREFVLQRLWSQVLNIEASEISADDSWITIGGDSIAAIRLVAVAQAHGVGISVSNILGSPSLARQAELISFTDPSDELPRNRRASQRGRVQEMMEDNDIIRVIEERLELSVSEVEDIAPATDFQAEMFVSGKMFARGWSNYLILDVALPSDHAQIVAAFDLLAAHHPILRTLFLNRKSKVLQVVARSVAMEIEPIYCADLELVSQAWTEADMKKPSTLDKPILRGAFLTAPTGKNRVILGLSHALYDGVSIPTLREDFMRACESMPSLSRPSFASFAEHVTSSNAQSHEFWKETLSGSKMTEIVHHSKPVYQHPMTSTLSRTIPAPNAAANGYTFTTLLRAAWGNTLAQWAGTKDVIFGQLVSGRSVSFSDIDKLIGPCVNILPVRVQLDSPTTSDLLQQIHAQHIASLPFEATGFSDIVANCTDWRRWTRFSSIVQHQNIDDVASILSPEIASGDVSLICPDHDFADVWVISVPEADNVRIDLSFSPQVISDEVASTLLDAVCHVLKQFAQSLDGMLPDLSESMSALPSLPLRPDGDSELAGVNGVTDSSSNIDIQGLENVIEDLWVEIGLGEADMDTPFYDLSGNLVPALQMVDSLNRRFGTDIGIEILVEHSTRRKQAALVVGCMEEHGDGVAW